ncbi:hypothetical protein BZA70DRAFT_257849 [Myxozyma melibiosi]|uniref:RING-type E3 ubiquitin transferase n=1 Tax=Myxozyma melibiosi TaxID=54550 RepID=A0ABR1F815_9ASCO
MSFNGDIIDDSDEMETDTCRICRGEGTAEEPLYHPCKCSGSIKYVHQECLQEWLQHSQRKPTCELCKTPFKFTKLYAPDMPTRIPFFLLAEKLLDRIRSWIFLYQRLILVAFVWIIWLPLSTRYAVRVYFWLSDEMFETNNNTLAETIFLGGGLPVDPAAANATVVVPEPAAPSLGYTIKHMIFGDLVSDPLIEKLLDDTFEGQVITGLVIFVVALVFLIREWVLQNAAWNVNLPDPVRAVPVVDERPLGEQVMENIQPGLLDAPRRDREPANDAAVALRQDAPGDQDAGGAGHEAGVIDLVEEERDRLEFAARARQLVVEHFADAGPDRPNLVDLLAQHHREHQLEILRRQQNNEGELRQRHNLNDANRAPIDVEDGQEEQQPAVEVNAADAQMRLGQLNLDELMNDIAQPIEPEPEEEPEQEPEANVEEPGLWETVGAWLQEYIIGGDNQADAERLAGAIDVVDNFDAMMEPAARRLEDEEAVEDRDGEGDDDGDDFDGVLEFIGVRGPLSTLFQNGSFATVMMTGTLALALWVPYLIGKFVLMVMSHPVTFFGVLPIRVMAFIANQGVDIFIVVLMYGVFGVRLYIEISEQLTNITTTKYFPWLAFWLKDEADMRVISESWARIVERQNDATALLGGSGMNDIKLVLMNPAWLKYIHGGVVPDHTTAIDRVVAVFAGYLFLIVLGALYLSRWSKKKGNRRMSMALERVIVEVLGQAGAILKVIVIIAIELVVFPLFCGILLDVALLPLFDGASIASRWEFTLNHPFVSVFLHWFAGTCYMFHFALFVSMCREIVRPGLLFFIRDPNDPNFHPIRDVLDRPVLMQLRKIIISAFIYCSLICICLGGVVYGLRCVVGGGILPIHWAWNGTMGEAPIELLMYQVFMAYLLKFFKPSGVVENSWEFFFRKAASVLRLTSFILGREVPLEQGKLIFRSPIDWMLSFFRDPQGIEPIRSADEINETASQVLFLRDGEFVRAPSSDSVHLRKERHEFVVVNKDNRRLDGKEDTPEDLKDTTVVYTPPHFRVRIACLLAGIWMYATACGLFVTLGPLLLGREIFEAVTDPERPMNDVISFTFGAYIFCAAYMVGEFLVTNREHIRQKYLKLVHSFSHPQEFIRKIIGIYISAGKFVYVYAALGFVIPSLLGLTIELYIVIPLHLYYSAEQPIIHVIQSWALGLLYCRGIYKISSTIRPNSRLETALASTFANGYARPNARVASNKIIKPAVLFFGVFLLAPVLIVFAAQFALRTDVSQDVLVASYRLIYPAILLLLLIIFCYRAVRRVCSSWNTRLRDEVYLVGMQLHNHADD